MMPAEPTKRNKGTTGMTMARIMSGDVHNIVSCSPQASVREAAGLLAERRIGALPVLEDERVVGIFSERDLLYCVAKEGGAVLDRPVSQVMTAPPITVDPATDPLDAMSLMTKRRIRHLPVVEHGRMIGFVSIGDLVKHRIELIESEAQAMRDYIRTA
jgi:CBS domain-containing protein